MNQADTELEQSNLLFQIQLVHVSCATVRAEQRERAGQTTAQEARVRLSTTDLADDARAFSCRLEVAVEVPVGDEDLADIFVVVQGDFGGISPIDGDLYQKYIAFTPVALLWPYARAYVAQLASMLAVSVPPLPSLDVLGQIGNERPEES